MWRDLWEHMQSPLLYALPMFAVFIVAEATALRYSDQHQSRQPYQFHDAWTSIVMGLGSLVFLLVFKIATLVVFVFLSTQFAPWHIPTDTWWSWVLVFVAVDFTWYLNHRFSHVSRIGWAGHRAHHSTEYFNLGTAVRLKWNPWSEAVFWAPLPLLGFAPWTIYVAYSVNMIYQFFLHTETVGTLPRPLEFVLNTPSHHRVHHGREPVYIDRNYGGVFIVWDRMFGSFQAELHRPDYGLSSPADPHDMFELQYGEYRRIATDVRRSSGLRKKLGCVFGSPGRARPPAPRFSEQLVSGGHVAIGDRQRSV